MSFQSSRNRESKQISRNYAELATVTSPGEEISALGIGEYRDVVLMAPYGINWCPPVDYNVQLLKSWRSGVRMSAIGAPTQKEVKPEEIEIYGKDSSIFLNEDGEIKLEAKGGASILLNTDGTILLNNHFKINPDGSTERV